MDQDQDALVRNAASQKQVKRAGQKEERSRRQELDDLKHLLSQSQFRRFVRRYIGHCDLYGRSADNSGSWTYFNEGVRSVGVMLLKDVMTADLGAYCQMLQDEQKEKENGN